jgi:O-antigen/teichoic acid export membrane protein
VTIISEIQDRLIQHLPVGSLRRRLASGVFWSLMGAVAVQLSNALASIVVARILGKSVFGDLGMVRNTTVMFGVFAGMGLGMTASKYVAQYRTLDPQRAGRILTLCLIVSAAVSLAMSVAVFFGADSLAGRFLDAPRLGPLIRICAPLLFCNAINSVQSAGIGGIESFRQLSICNAINAIVLSLATICGALMRGIEGAVWGSLVGIILGCIVLEVAAELLRRRHGIQLVFRGLWREHSAIVHFAFPALLANVLYQPVVWLVLAMLYTRADGPGEVAIFNAASQWRNLVLFVPVALGQVVLPTLTNLWSSGSSRGYLRTLQAHSLASLMVGAAAAIPIICASPLILATYGPGFTEGWIAMSLLAASAVLQATCSVIGQSLASLGRMWAGFVLNLLWALELYVAARLLIGYGVTGLAAAFLIGYALHTLQVGAFTMYSLRHSLLSDRSFEEATNTNLSDEGLM